jgi:hypothetical protein
MEEDSKIPKILFRTKISVKIVRLYYKKFPGDQRRFLIEGYKFSGEIDLLFVKPLSEKDAIRKPPLSLESPLAQ